MIIPVERYAYIGSWSVLYKEDINKIAAASFIIFLFLTPVTAISETVDCNFGCHGIRKSASLNAELHASACLRCIEAVAWDPARA